MSLSCLLLLEDPIHRLAKESGEEAESGEASGAVAYVSLEVRHDGPVPRRRRVRLAEKRPHMKVH